MLAPVFGLNFLFSLVQACPCLWTCGRAQPVRQQLHLVLYHIHITFFQIFFQNDQRKFVSFSHSCFQVWNKEVVGGSPPHEGSEEVGHEPMPIEPERLLRTHPDHPQVRACHPSGFYLYLSESFSTQSELQGNQITPLELKIFSGQLRWKLFRETASYTPFLCIDLICMKNQPL